MNAYLNRPGRFFRQIMAGCRQAWIEACQVWLILMAVLLGPGLAWAGEPNRAGLVVQFADGRTETICVEFEEKEITGADLLVRSGLDAVVDPSSGLGIIVCRIEGQGCNYPAETCFCQCSGSGPCAYWNYFYQDPGQDGWTYAALGALRHKIRPGSVDAWVWGDGTTPPAADLTYEAVCPSPTQAAALPATSMPQRPALPVATVTSAPTLEPTQTRPVELPISVATPSPTGQGASAYWLFGGLVLILAFAGAIAWARTRK
jgi:hypothetical protein